jgi:hypothetical protein
MGENVPFIAELCVQTYRYWTFEAESLHSAAFKLIAVSRIYADDE